MILIFFVAGCRTATIPEPTKNLVSPETPLPIVKQIILRSINNSGKTQWDAPTTTAQKVLREVFASISTHNRWDIEAIEPDGIRASTRHRNKHYVAVKVHYTDTEWWVAIVDGKNIKFDGESIHEKAILWVEALEQRIRRAFGTYQTMIELEQ